MTNTEYVARVIRYYSKNKPKLGTLEFDLMQGRFIIKDQKGKPVSSYPGTGLHCGDVYIVQNTDKSWHIAQCELVEDIWKMVGSDITDESEPTGVIYVPHDRLVRFADFWVDDTWKLGALSNEFINMLLRK